MIALRIESSRTEQIEHVLIIFLFSSPFHLCVPLQHHTFTLLQPTTFSSLEPHPSSICTSLHDFLVCTIDRSRDYDTCLNQ